MSDDLKEQLIRTVRDSNANARRAFDEHERAEAAERQLAEAHAVLREIAEQSDDLCQEGFGLEDVASLGATARAALPAADREREDKT